MSFYEGLDFFICLILALVPAFFLKLSGKSLRGYITVASALFLALLFKDDLVQLAYFAAYILLMVHVVFLYLALSRRYPRNKKLYVHFLILALLPLVLCKVSGLFGSNIFGFIGISYITFKVVQMVIEIYDGVITQLDVFDVLAFLIFFPTFTSGPIDRSRRFSEDIHRSLEKNQYLELAGTGLKKIVLGVAYKFAFSAIAYSVLQNVFAERCAPLYVVGYAYTYGIYMFFDFAGYSLMAVGVSYILGICTPDNFRLPFISKDISDFWNRWHISLSTWFRDFIFSRFMISSIKAKRFKNRLTAAQVGLIVNMLIMGVWHGISVSYIAYGLYHGVLLAVAERYHKKSAFYKKNKNRKWYCVLSWFVTLNLVMLGFLIFSGRAVELLNTCITLLL